MCGYTDHGKKVFPAVNRYKRLLKLSRVSKQTISNVSLELGDWLSYCRQQSTVANYHIK